MTNTSDSPNAAPPAGSHRQRKIAHANERTKALIRRRVDWFAARGFPAEQIARIVGVPVERVLGEMAE